MALRFGTAPSRKDRMPPGAPSWTERQGRGRRARDRKKTGDDESIPASLVGLTASGAFNGGDLIGERLLHRRRGGDSGSSGRTSSRREDGCRLWPRSFVRAGFLPLFPLAPDYLTARCTALVTTMVARRRTRQAISVRAETAVHVDQVTNAFSLMCSACRLGCRK